MKKFLSVLLALISVICVAFAFGGCEEEQGTGAFYTLTEAYEKGYLTREQVMSIAYYQCEEYSFLEKDEKISDENYMPLPLTPNQLSAETQEAIKQTCFNFINAKSEVEIRSISYYGTYNSCVAVMIEAYIGYTAAEWTERVADININYSSGNRIYIWRQS